METSLNNAASMDASNSQMSSPDVSQGIPMPMDNAPMSAEVSQGTPQMPQEGQSAGDPTLTTPTELKAASERLKQQNARQAKLLSSLGIDPLSDIGEQLENGLITADMVKNHVLGKNQSSQQVNQTQQVANDPSMQAQQEYEEAKAACDAEGQQTGQISFETMRRYNEAAFKLQDVKATSVTRQMTADKMAQQANESVERVLTVARQGNVYAGLPDNAKQISDFAHIAMTNAIAYREAPQMGLDPNNLTPKQFEYFAQKATQQTGVLVEQLIDLGRRQALQNQSPIKPRQNFVPAGPGGQPVGLNNPFSGVNHTNHLDAARRYAAGSGGQA